MPDTSSQRIGCAARTNAEDSETVETGALRKTLLVLGGFVALAYFVTGIVGALWPGHWDEASAADEILWDTLLIGGGIAVAVGLWLVDRSPSTAWRESSFCGGGA